MFPPKKGGQGNKASPYHKNKEGQLHLVIPLSKSSSPLPNMKQSCS